VSVRCSARALDAVDQPQVHPAENQTHVVGGEPEELLQPSITVAVLP
jgi:hypothetical protein